MKLSLAQVTSIPSSEEKAYDFVESILWPDGPVCPHCRTLNHAYRIKNQRTRTGRMSQRKLWKCGACKRQFTVTIGTAMEGSKIPLSKWILAFNLFCAGKNGVSSTELERQLDITHEAAWFLSHRMRYAMERRASARLLTGTVEVDETYYGGRVKGQGRGRGAYESNKTPIVALVKRNGEVRSQAVPKGFSRMEHGWCRRLVERRASA
jgi:transposase-like protein